MAADGFRSRPDEGEVRLPMVVQRSRNADDNRVHLAQQGKVHRRPELVSLDLMSNFSVGNVFDVAGSLAKRFDVCGIDIEPGGLATLLCEETSNREPHVAHPGRSYCGDRLPGPALERGEDMVLSVATLCQQSCRSRSLLSL